VRRAERSKATWLAALAAVLVTQGRARAEDTAPPDPRSGETLDGREPPTDPDRLTLLAPRLLLWPVRAVSWLVLTPVEGMAGFVEHHQLYERTYEALTSDDRQIGLRPMIYYETSIAPTVGLRYFDHRSLGQDSNLEAWLRAGPRSTYTGISVSPPGMAWLQARGGFDRRTDAIFAGTTGESTDDLNAQGLEITRYSYNRLWSEVRATAFFGGWSGLSGRVAIERRTYGNGTATAPEVPIRDQYCVGPVSPDCVVSPVLVPGFDEGMRAVRPTLTFGIDTRHDQRYGTGVLARIDGEYVQGIAGDPIRDLIGIARAGVVGGLGDHALLLYGTVGAVGSLGDAPVQFEDLLSASGPTAIRGLPTGRLRGHTETIGTIEYRWLLAPWLDAALSVDRGNAFGSNFEGWSWSDMLTSYALAFRFQERRRAYWTSSLKQGVQVAYTPGEGWRLLFAVGFW
jgi:hypothetical protein